MATPPDPLLDVHAFVVLLAGLLGGALAGTLSYLASPNIPAAILIGLGALAVTLPLVHAMIARH